MSTARDKALKALERHSHLHGTKENTGKIGYSGTESEKLEKEALQLDEKLQKLEKAEKESINLALEDMVAFKRNGESTITIMDAAIAAKEYMGATGPKGADSTVVGPRGADGSHGMDGQPGIHGVDGLQGQVGMAGPQGRDGSSLLSGYEDPTGSIGKDGDHYFNDATDTIFGPKDGGIWPAGVSLVGAQGAQGAQGPQGLTGLDGVITDILSTNNTWTGTNNFNGIVTTTVGFIPTVPGSTNGTHVGNAAGAIVPGDNVVAVGWGAGYATQGDGAVAVGYTTALSGQGIDATAIGSAAGNSSQGAYSVAVGHNAGPSSQGDNGIIINATGLALDDATDDHIHIATADGSLDYLQASGWTASHGAVVATFPATTGTLALTTDIVDLLPLDNTWTGVNTFTAATNTFEGEIHVEHYKVQAIPLNGNGATPPVAAFENTETQTITGAGDALFGQSLPEFIKDTGTYNINRASIYGCGALFYAGATVNFSGAPAFSNIAGPWNVLSSQCVFDKTTTSAVIFSNFAIDIQSTFKNTGGTGAFTGAEYGINHRPILETAVAGGTFCALVSNVPTLNGTATCINALGISVLPRTVASNNNIGYVYADASDWPNDGLEYSFYSKRGVLKNLAGEANATTIYSSGANTLGLANNYVILKSTATVVLPAVSAVPTGMTYRVLNITGSNSTATSASTIVGVSPVMVTNTSRTFISDGTDWNCMN